MLTLVFPKAVGPQMTHPELPGTHPMTHTVLCSNPLPPRHLLGSWKPHVPDGKRGEGTHSPSRARSAWLAPPGAFLSLIALTCFPILHYRRSESQLA